MAIHSNILVHWTGNSGPDDIEKKFKAHADKRAKEYVERLKDDYLNRGLYASRKDEASIRSWKIKRLVRICFTEIRLSQIRIHAERYGKLGIGFSRQFVLDRGGRPVIYVPFNPKKDCQLLEGSIDKLRRFAGTDKEIRKAVESIMAHVKRMSPDGRGNDDEFYEEMEWRLVYDENPANIYFAQDGEVYRLKFSPSDVKIIVFPDECTQRLALDDPVLRKLFSIHVPIMVTLEDCGNF